MEKQNIKKVKEIVLFYCKSGKFSLNKDIINVIAKASGKTRHGVKSLEYFLTKYLSILNITMVLVKRVDKDYWEKKPFNDVFQNIQIRTALLIAMFTISEYHKNNEVHVERFS